MPFLGAMVVLDNEIIPGLKGWLLGDPSSKTPSIDHNWAVSYFFFFKKKKKLTWQL